MDGELESCVIDTREVDSARGLVFLWFETERVDVDTLRERPRGMGLVDLNQIEVSSFTSSETIMTIELEFGIDHWVSEAGTDSHTLGCAEVATNSTEVRCIKHRKRGVNHIEGIQLVIRPLIANTGTRGTNVGVLLDNPDQLLAGMVERQTNLVAGVVDRLLSSVLELLDQVLVRDLCKRRRSSVSR